MSDGTNRPLNRQALTEPAAFRSAVAGIVRDLLSALIQTCPQLVSAEIRQKWWSDGNRPVKRPTDYLLKHAAQKLRDFTQGYAGYLDSVPFWEPSDELTIEDCVERLRELMLLFADPDELDAAARRVNDLKPKNWESLCRWESLTEVRSLLDKLPKSETLLQVNARQDQSDLATPARGIVLYQDLKIEDVRPQIWLLLSHLLCSNRHVSQFDTLSEQILDRNGNPIPPVWEDVPTNEKDGWDRLDSLKRHTNNFFKSNHIPYSVTRSKPLKAVRLKRVSSDQGPIRPHKSESRKKVKSRKFNRSTTNKSPRQRRQRSG